MYSIALKQGAISTLLFFASCACLASDMPPRILQEPVLGLRYEISKNKFDTLSKRELVNCDTFQNDENRSATWYVYGMFKEATGRTYYVSGGYETVHDPKRKEDKYETRNFGAVFFVDANKCVYLDEARQTFEDRIFNDEMPADVLQGLAFDVADRLQKAFGGAEHLKIELRNQRIDLDQLPLELKAAFRPYSLPKTTR